jgi:hypothetical protein
MDLDTLQVQIKHITFVQVSTLTVPLVLQLSHGRPQKFIQGGGKTGF